MNVAGARTTWLFTALICLAACATQAVASGASPAERDACVRAAAAHYYRPGYPLPYPAFVDLVRALMRVEGGCGMAVGNTNGSYDVGCMQINSTHFRKLASYGISADALRWNDCQNILVGTWILDSEITRGGDLWTSIGNYNSHTPKHNAAYQRKVWYALQNVWANRYAGR